MTGDAANNAAAANAMMLFVFFMFSLCLVLFLDLAAPDHVLSAIGVGDGCRRLHPVLVQHWAVGDVVTGLTDNLRLRLVAQLFECRASFLQRFCLSDIGSRIAQLSCSRLRARQIICG